MGVTFFFFFCLARKKKNLSSFFYYKLWLCEVTHIEDYNSPTKPDSHESHFHDISLNLFQPIDGLFPNQLDSFWTPVTSGQLRTFNSKLKWRSIFEYNVRRPRHRATFYVRFDHCKSYRKVVTYPMWIDWLWVELRLSIRCTFSCRYL